MTSRMSDILRFDIPDARNDFRNYVYELLFKRELSTDVLAIVLNAMVDISVDIKKGHDERLISEIAYWEGLGYGLVEMNFIFYKSIIDVSYTRLELAYANIPE